MQKEIILMKERTLRDTITTKSSIIHTFNKILLKTDLPYNFDQINKYWWRWYNEIYGFYYNRIKRSYSIWLMTLLKKNIALYMPFFFSIPNKRSLPLDKWKRRVFLYHNSFIQKKNIIKNFAYKLKFDQFEPYYFLLSEAAKRILLPFNRNKRVLGSFGAFDKELDMFFSSYNSNWNNIYDYNALFYNVKQRMAKNFLIIVNSFFINSDFFINSFDSEITINTHRFLKYNYNINKKKTN